jgi:serine/threonine protein kinase
MSPEQYKGAEVDYRTDIWSLGVVINEMLTGSVPFEGDYEAAVMYSVLNDEPKHIRYFYPAIPEKLDRIVQKCLLKDKNKRYQSVESLSADLIRIREETKKTSAVHIDSYQHGKEKSVL